MIPAAYTILKGKEPKAVGHSVNNDAAFHDIGIRIIRADGQKIEDVIVEKSEAFYGNDHGLD